MSDFFANSPVPALAYKHLYAVWVSHPVADGITLSLTYAGQIADDGSVPAGVTDEEIKDQQLLMLSTNVAF